MQSNEIINEPVAKFKDLTDSCIKEEYHESIMCGWRRPREIFKPLKIDIWRVKFEPSTLYAQIKLQYVIWSRKHLITLGLNRSKCPLKPELDCIIDPNGAKHGQPIKLNFAQVPDPQFTISQAAFTVFKVKNVVTDCLTVLATDLNS